MRAHCLVCEPVMVETRGQPGTTNPQDDAALIYINTMLSGQGFLVYLKASDMHS